MGERLHERHFTLAEARTALPRVAKRVATLVAAKRACEELGFAVEERHWRGGWHLNGDGPYPKPFLRLVAITQELGEAGILLKDLDRGLIDFPHLRSDGEEVYLCWLLGEPELAWWHRIPDGFAGRRPLETL